MPHSHHCRHRQVSNSTVESGTTAGHTATDHMSVRCRSRCVCAFVHRVSPRAVRPKRGCAGRGDCDTNDTLSRWSLLLRRELAARPGELSDPYVPTPKQMDQTILPLISYTTIFTAYIKKQKKKTEGVPGPRLGESRSLRRTRNSSRRCGVALNAAVPGDADCGRLLETTTPIRNRATYNAMMQH